MQKVEIIMVITIIKLYVWYKIVVSSMQKLRIFIEVITW